MKACWFLKAVRWSCSCTPCSTHTSGMCITHIIYILPPTVYLCLSQSSPFLSLPTSLPPRYSITSCSHTWHLHVQLVILTRTLNHSITQSLNNSHTQPHPTTHPRQSTWRVSTGPLGRIPSRVPPLEKPVCAFQRGQTQLCGDEFGDVWNEVYDMMWYDMTRDDMTCWRDMIVWPDQTWPFLTNSFILVQHTLHHLYLIPSHTLLIPSRTPSFLPPSPPTESCYLRYVVRLPFLYETKTIL